MTRTILLTLLLLSLLVPHRAWGQLGQRELHDRIVAVYQSRAVRPLPHGDTLVSWYGNPVLFHIVARRADTVETAMVRADSLLGTARVVWHGGMPLSASIWWGKGSEATTTLEVILDTDTIRSRGSQVNQWPRPTLPWAIADYGMEDQVLPLLPQLPTGSLIAVFRPFAAKWDTLAVASQALGAGVLYELRKPDGKRDWWLVSRAGTLLQIRREGQNFERRPLELTPPYEEYRALKALLPSAKAPLPSN
jgi:hypothetical protein